MTFRRALGRLSVALAIVGGTTSLQSQPARSSTGIAYLAIDLRTGRTLAEERAERLDAPLLPGSVIKMATLAAALESGVVTPRTGILCTRSVTVDGHVLTCTHPDLLRPLEAAEALAHSCNVYFATVSARTPRSALDHVLTDLGLPTTDPGTPLTAEAVGIEGLRVAPRQLIGAVAKIAADPSPLPWRPETLAAVREGLFGAATYGTASALGAHGIDALAKTGTVIDGGIERGLVVGVSPRSRPEIGFVLLTAGAAGLDAAALAAERLASRPRSDTIRVGIAKTDGGYTIRTMSIDDYVAGVVAGEADAGSSPAALAALAITVRTYTEANRNRHASDGFDLCDLTHCQVLRAATATTTRAATATSGRVLLDLGQIAHVFYTGSCGGYSERPSAVWKGAPDPSYLPSRPDTDCEGQPVWSSEVPVGDVSRALGAGRFRGDLLRNITVTSRTMSGRVAWLHLDGFTPAEISGDDFRTLIGRTLGWQYVKSTMFDVSRTGSGFRFSGRGAGHGVGLCVLGAAKLGARGTSTADILARYFPGLTTGTLGGTAATSTQIDLTLPAAARGQDSTIRAMVSDRIGALSAALRVAPPARVAIRVHPTVESYQRDTGQPWFTAGATTGSTIDLLPLAALEQRGILRTTIAHELVHLLTADALKDRPRWVVEGVAAYYASEDQSSAPASCPSDGAISRPASAESLRRAMADARACVAAKLKAGSNWRDLR